jgi:ketosteroid isomerase-like protein
MKKIVSVIILSISILTVGSAQTKQEAAVATAVEQLRKAMVDADSVMLDKLTSDKLSYGHSGGHVDDKAEFIQKIASGKSDFVSIDLSEQTISISGKIAVVRHKLNAFTNDNGKPAEVHLLVLLVWQKTGKYWELLARQAVKNQ